MSGFPINLFTSTKITGYVFDLLASGQGSDGFFLEKHTQQENQAVEFHRCYRGQSEKIQISLSRYNNSMFLCFAESGMIAYAALLKCLIQIQLTQGIYLTTHVYKEK